MLNIFLQKEEVKSDLLANIFNTKEETEVVIQKCLNNIGNIITVEVERKGKVFEFENILRTTENNNLYLLESRLFDKNTNRIKNVYLRVFDKNKNFVEEDIEDVYSYANWVSIK